MDDVEIHRSNDPRPVRSWLPSPGILFALTMMGAMTSVCFWIGSRAYRQQARPQSAVEVCRRVRPVSKAEALLQEGTPIRLESFDR